MAVQDNVYLHSRLKILTTAAVVLSTVVPTPTTMGFSMTSHPPTMIGSLSFHPRWKNQRLAFPGKSSIKSHRFSTALRMSIDSVDPFQVLGLNEPTSDKKAIKRAYKRMALKYHPDVATNKDSTAQEKKEASDRFAKINAAYQVLSGKDDSSTYAYGSTSASKTGASTGWTPPHRRSGSTTGTGTSYSSSSASRNKGGGASWEDFMPQNEDDKYATNDSLGQIFSDMFVGAAAGAAGLGGGGNILNDFLEFLEGNVSGFGSDADDDAELRVLLQTGSVEDIGNEMDDTELVLKQLRSKLRAIDDEILTTTADAKMSTRYLEKIELEESLAELNARKDVVEGYVKKTQKRLLALQMKYKDLITRGGNDSYAGGKSSSWDELKTESGRSSSAKNKPAGDTTSSSSYTGGGASSTGRPSSGNKDDAWMNEGFGSSSYGRGGRGSRRRSRRSGPRESPTGSSAESSSRGGASSQRERTRSETSGSEESPRQTSAPSSGYTSGRRTSGRPTTTDTPSISSNVPPHRRTSSYESYQEADKRRMREIKVDEEFDKLKKDLGL